MAIGLHGGSENRVDAGNPLRSVERLKAKVDVYRLLQ
jgi:hypothetical protein